MIQYVILVSLTLGLGASIIFSIWPNDSSWRGLLLHISWGIGPGIGLASVLFFLSKVLKVTLSREASWMVMLVVITMLLLLLSLIAYLRQGKKVSLDFNLPPMSFRWLWLALVGLAFILFTNGFLAHVLTTPDGDWDAWAIWNMHARFLAQDGDTWLRMFDPALYATHPDYPLLTPSFIAFGWKTYGRINSFVPVVTAALFSLGTASLLFTALNFQRKFLAACLATVTLLFSSSLLDYSANLYADLPLAFEILAATIGLYFWIWKRRTSTDESKAFLVLVGLFCGLATWTKNEGWSLLVAVLAGMIVLNLQERTPVREIKNQFGLFLAGLLPALIVSLYFKFILAPSNDLFVERSLGDIFLDLFNLSRWGTILKHTLDAINFYDYRIFIILLFFGLVIGYGMYRRSGFRVIWLILFLILIQYMVIYAITPQDLEWHLDTSLERLITQLFPAILYLVFAGLNLSDAQTRILDT